MLQKLGHTNKNKLILLVLVCLLFAACSPLTPNQTPGIGTKTPKPAPSQSWGSNASQYGLIALVDWNVSTIFLFSPGSRFQKSYQLTGENDPLEVEQVTYDCGLIVLARSSGSHKLIRLDRTGSVQQEIFSLKNTRGDESLYSPLLSGTGKYVAYVVFSGELYYDTAQHQDIEVVKLDDPDRPVRLTSHGGAWKDGGIWSPDGTELAYTDYDDQGVLQVYITRMTGEMPKKQITQFKEPGRKAGPIRWSPAGDRLAVVLQGGEHGESLWVVRAQGDSAFELDLPNSQIPVDGALLWSADGSSLLFNLGYTDTGLYWFDVRNNRLLYVLTPKDVSRMDPGANSFAYMFPLTTDLSQIIFYNSWDSWYVYDAAQRQLEHVAWLETRQWGSHVEISVFPNDISTCNP